MVTGIVAGFGHYDCHHVLANIDSPEPGTPRANYCSVVDAGSGWAMFLAPLLVAALAFALVRRRSDRVKIATGVVAAVVILNWFAIGYLSPEYTI